MLKKQFRETIFFTEAALNAKVDRAGHQINHVCMLSVNSLNARRYPVPVMEKALPLFEGTKSYLNHSRENVRDVKDYIGQFHNCRVEEGKMFGNLTLARFPDLYDIAEITPSAIGFSVDISGYSEESEDGIETVTEIIAANSVDLVTEPAATKGLFESINHEKEETMELKDLPKVTMTELKENAPKLYEMVFQEGVKSRAQEVTTLTEERDQLKTEKETRLTEEKEIQKKKVINDLLKASDLPETAITDSFKESLYGIQPKTKDGIEITIEAQAKELIEDRVLLVTGGKVHDNYEHFDESGKTKPKKEEGNEDVELQETFCGGKNSTGFIPFKTSEK